MKRVKFLLVVFLIAGFSHAQENRPQKPHKEKRSSEEMIRKGIDRMQEKLELNEEQTGRIKALMEDHHQEMKAEREAFRSILEAHHKKMQEKREELSEKIQSSLTEEQKETFQEMEMRRKERIKKDLKKRRDERMRKRAPRP
ncbi:periplasmic heavy metal sensor [Marinilabilia rubra]|uniref:Periplasmic heavy metal sensor n=1 Tax=Marinilabilia rubra TaxID=2162893 RepID=A0A2U2B8R3_9BACT|nr:periplasmic heavy metal sensor [Marinilabilia rubra]PWD99433.1 hypothetical protein DDZ16_10520 [Marinilabilia rubra]